MNIFKSRPPPPRSVLFICTANVTRSPVAEMMFRELVEKSGEIWSIASAGIKGVKGLPANQVISFIMSRRGQSIRRHRSQPVSKKLLSRYQWIIVMQEAHRLAVIELDKNIEDRVFLFRSLSSNAPLDNPDMPDPTGKDVDDYQELFSILDEEMPQLYKVVRDKAYELEMKDNDDELSDSEI